MINTTAYWLELDRKRATTQQGIHTLLRQEPNQYIYPLAFVLTFALMYTLINKIVYYVTSGPFVMQLCINKYKLKSKSKSNKNKNKIKNKEEAQDMITSSTMMILLNDDDDDDKDGDKSKEKDQEKEEK